METREIKNENVEQRNKLNEPWIPTEQELQVEKMVLPDSLPTPEPVKTDNTTNNENE
jgi:hypothetical protein